LGREDAPLPLGMSWRAARPCIAFPAVPGTGVNCGLRPAASLCQAHGLALDGSPQDLGLLDRSVEEAIEQTKTIWRGVAGDRHICRVL
jgi:hypothetical protein